MTMEMNLRTLALNRCRHVHVFWIHFLQRFRHVAQLYTCCVFLLLWLLLNLTHLQLYSCIVTKSIISNFLLLSILTSSYYRKIYPTLVFKQNFRF